MHSVSADSLICRNTNVFSFFPEKCQHGNLQYCAYLLQSKLHLFPWPMTPKAPHIRKYSKQGPTSFPTGMTFFPFLSCLLPPLSIISLHQERSNMCESPQQFTHLASCWSWCFFSAQEEIILKQLALENALPAWMLFFVGVEVDKH